MRISLIFCLLFLTGTLIAQPGPSEKEIISLIRDGVDLHDSGDYEGALIRYNQALELDPDYTMAMYEIGFTYMAMGENKKAQKWMKKVIKADGEFVGQAYQVLGSLQDDSGKPKKAIKTYQKAIALYPDDYLLHYNLALTYTRLEQWADAANSLEEALSLEPTHESSLALMSISQEELGNKVKALLSGYLFLLLEPDSDRSQEVVNVTLRQILPDYTEDEEGNINLNMVLNEEDEFAAAAMAIDLAGLSLIEETDGEISMGGLFAGINEVFFSVLDESQDGQEGIWWEWFVFFFTYIHEAGHTEALSYYMWQSQGGEISDWIEYNDASMEAFFGWIDNL